MKNIVIIIQIAILILDLIREGLSEGEIIVAVMDMFEGVTEEVIRKFL
ncbi:MULTISPECIES: hypothetical protein [unclassified Clostridium]|nr:MULTISPECIES: hypothetical protein [unclassified Clostridium]EKQ55891.1 MAG: hypothetical protein A370_02464 [Clostridium sp. Maddingley MBC34-26]MDR3596445.1 hypothetical protein [Clostridium sp.]